MKEQLFIQSIDSKLNNKEKKVRRYIMNYIIDNKKPFNYIISENEIVKSLGMETSEYKSIIEELKKKIVISADEDHNVNFIYPVSALPTNHRVSLEDGREFTAMCGIDAMGSSFAFKQDVTINSICAECGEAVAIEIKNGELVSFSPENLHVLHVDLNKNDNWAGSC